MMKIFVVLCLLAITAKTCFSLSWITKQVDKLKKQPRKCAYDGEVWGDCDLRPIKRTFPKMWPKDIPIKFKVENGVYDQHKLVREVTGFLTSEGIQMTETRDNIDPVIIFRWVLEFCGIEGQIGYNSIIKEQIIYMTPDCDNTPAIAHLLMHRLGFTHEINHPNRDDYVMILDDNVAENEKMHFVKYEASEYPTLYDFDPKSVMQYQYDDFQEDVMIPVMIPLTRDISPFDFLRSVWQNDSSPRQVFSVGDMNKLRDAFGSVVVPVPGK